MKITDLLTKARIENKEFLKAEDLRRFCKGTKFDYNYAVKYLVEHKYLIRIFRGIFYVKSHEEIATKRLSHNVLELISKGLELKGIKNWYFGFHTALKLNNLTHEYYTTGDVINDSISRPKSMLIADHKFKFYKLSPKLLSFGITKENNIKYSDIEKTILDFIYIWSYNGISNEKILADVSEWTSKISETRVKKYSIRYPNSTRKIIKMILK
ncbi:type IV toxin-antitoxin system AbiEi family antitoxin domain-containing protein [Nitrosopumilus ureiphilus]|uniref:AbiEi antitoxin C-terminal domain-containing protein n=1 Tax=Nitrosopumilus ureiphilus TaxID=1470067 RepID=A0A7D5M5U6_9ARCH|nr:hypothetical protein [Nitrosopumilus ureiphilus]QLH06731.1 hypothetical protein C5F50_06305 [Nitrosopumilus ureiphilus]